MRAKRKPWQAGILLLSLILISSVGIGIARVVTGCNGFIESKRDCEVWLKSRVNQRPSAAATAEAFVVALAYHDEAIFEFTSPQLWGQIENIMTQHSPPECSTRFERRGEVWSGGNGSDYFSTTYSCYLRNSSTLFTVRAEGMTLLKVDGQWIVTAVKNLYVRKS